MKPSQLPIIRSFVQAPETRSGYVDPVTKTHILDTYTERTTDGVYAARNGQVWLYRALKNVPLRYDTQEGLLGRGRELVNMLADLGSSSIPKPPLVPEAPAGFSRNIHIATVRWSEVPEPPAGIKTVQHADFLRREVLRFYAPTQTTFVGIELRDTGYLAQKRNATSIDLARDFINRAFDDSLVGLERYERDRDWVHQTLARSGCRIPTRDEFRQLEAWFNNGSHGGAEIAVPVKAPADYLLIDRRHRLEFVALEQFTAPVFEPPWQEWLADALDHPDGPCVVSIRAELQHVTDTRKKLRKSIKERRLAEDERRMHGQDSYAEEDAEFDLVRFAESKMGSPDATSTLRGTSIIFGRRTDGAPATETYVDFLRQRYGIEAVPLAHRQLEALEETLPCAQKRGNPFPQQLSLEMVGYSGIGMFSDIGSKAGANLGRALPDGTTVYHDVFEAARRNLGAPAMLIAGDSGSGKTMASLNIAHQTALGGDAVVMINPKGSDSLRSMIDYMSRQGIETEWVAMSHLFSSNGAGTYDPFRYAPSPEMAADIAANLITTVLEEFDQRQRTSLRYGLSLGAKNGARCVGQALEYVDDDVRREIMHLASSSPLFALSIGNVPKPSLERQSPGDGGHAGRFILIEFDQDLALPTEVKQHGYTETERLALSAIRAVTTASVGMLAQSGGGLMVMDEAHTVLGHPDTINLISNVMRKARSLNLAQIYATQLVSDLINVRGTGQSLEAHISTVLALKMSDKQEAAASLKLIGYDPEPSYIEWMADFGPRRTEAGQQPAHGFYRDLEGRKTLISLGPLAPGFIAAASTNPDDKALRQTPSLTDAPQKPQVQT